MGVYNTVLLSGGLDSAVTLFFVLESQPKESVLAVSFDYGQTNISELEAAKELADEAGVAHKIVDLSKFLGPLLGKETGGALIDHTMELEGENDDRLSSVFVPGRNLMFLLVAALVSIGHFNIDVRDKNLSDILDLYIGVTTE